MPVRDDVFYVVVGRHPLDMAVSLYHQSLNIDRGAVSRRTGNPERMTPRAPLHDWLMSWVERDREPSVEMDGLRGVMWHLGDAWSRRFEPNVILVHYDDLSSDLEGEMRRLARLLGFAVPEAIWPDLVEAARFDSMRRNAETLAPGRGVLRDPAAFFRRGRSGAGKEVLSEGEYALYLAHVAELAPPDMLSWLHRSARGA